MSRKLPPTQPEQCLISSRKSKYPGGTVIAEDVWTPEEHCKRLSDPDGYRPQMCGNCGHRVLHVHDYPERRPLGLLLTAVVRVVRFICANKECKATWRVLPGFLARHLWWAWRPIEQATMEPFRATTTVWSCSCSVASSADGTALAGTVGVVGTAGGSADGQSWR